MVLFWDRSPAAVMLSLPNASGLKLTGLPKPANRGLFSSVPQRRGGDFLRRSIPGRRFLFSFGVDAMTQLQLEQLVAEATGEDIQAIHQRGFSVADPFEVDFDPEPDNLPPQMVDWDELDLQRNLAVVSQGRIRHFG
jgi:hypothetical protein